MFTVFASPSAFPYTIHSSFPLPSLCFLLGLRSSNRSRFLKCESTQVGSVSVGERVIRILSSSFYG